MINTSSSCHRLLCLGLLALGLAACGSAEQFIGDSEQPITASDSEAQETGGQDACSGGLSPDDAAPEECQVVARGLCFGTADAACACAGCGGDECALAESFPAQAVCPSGNLGSNPDAPVSDGSEPDAPVSDGSEPDAPVSSGSGVPGHTGNTSPGSPGSGGIDASAPDHSAPPDPGGEQPCDFVVDGTCFEDADGACAAAGCAAGACLILESYPAQIGCS